MFKMYSCVILILFCIGLSSCSDNFESEKNIYIETYIGILESNIPFLYQGINIYLNDFLYEPNDIDGEYTYEITHFVVVDMDDDNIPELILHLLPSGHILVLHYENDFVYGYGFGVRSLGHIKKDGTFGWSSGAGYWGRSRLQFSADTYEIIDICRIESYDYGHLHYINEEEVTETEFDLFVAEQDAKEDEEWHEFNGANINRLGEFFCE